MTIDWGDGSAVEPVSPFDLVVGIDHTYFDDGDYEVFIEITDDDGGIGDDTAIVHVDNIDPELTLDTSGEIAFPGGDYSVVGVGEDLELTAEGEDLGSDDLIFTWSTGAVNTYFNDGIGPDPAMSSAGNSPFEAEDSGILNEANPGVSVLSVVLNDDDGGEAESGSSNVLVLGSDDATHGSGWWKQQYSANGNKQVDLATASAYREIVNAVSGIFDEVIAAANQADVHSILSPTGNDPFGRARAELMLAWLSFASGAVAHDANVPALGGGTIPFLDLMFDAEAIILNGGSSKKELLDLEAQLREVRNAI